MLASFIIGLYLVVIYSITAPDAQLSVSTALLALSQLFYLFFFSLCSVVSSVIRTHCSLRSRNVYVVLALASNFLFLVRSPSWSLLHSDESHSALPLTRMHRLPSPDLFLVFPVLHILTSMSPLPWMRSMPLQSYASVCWTLLCRPCLLTQKHVCSICTVRRQVHCRVGRVDAGLTGVVVFMSCFCA